MTEQVLILGGRRQGRTLQAEPTFRKALAEGKRVFTGGPNLNGVYFEVTLPDPDGPVVYTALTARPEGVLNDL